MSQSQKIQIITKWLPLTREDVLLDTANGHDRHELDDLVELARQTMREQIQEKRLASMV